MQFDVDINGKFSDVFFKVRSLLLELEGIKEIKNVKQTSYRDRSCRTVCMMRGRGDVFVLAFAQGARLQTKYPFLKGHGKVVRHVYFKNTDDIDHYPLREMLEETIILNLEDIELKKLKRAL